MNCVLKMELTIEINGVLDALGRLDRFMGDKHADTNLNAPEAFMSAWNKVKTARQTLLSINLENEAVL